MEKLLKRRASKGGRRVGWGLILFWLLGCVPAMGQDYIRNIPDINKIEHSVVRELNRESWLVYFYSPGQSGFSKQVQGGNSTGILNLPEYLYVNDFEVLGDYVYFCGHLFHNSQARTGVIGRFDYVTVNTFHPVELCIVNEADDIIKLEPYICETTPRIIAAGRMSDTTGVLIDMAYTGSLSVSLNMAVADTVGEMFSDVAVSDNMIYAASINKEYFLAHGRQWFFSRPTLLGVNPFAYYHSSHYAHTVISKGPLIENVGGDSVVFASKTAFMPKNFLYQYSSDVYYDGVQIVDIGNYEEQYNIVDVKYDDYSHTINLLTQKYPVWSYVNYLYSFNIPLSTGIVPVLCYKGYQLHSLEYRHHTPDMFITTGMHDENSELSMLHYLDRQVPLCGDRIEVETSKTSRPTRGDLKVKTCSVRHQLIKIQAVWSVTSILPVCN